MKIIRTVNLIPYNKEKNQILLIKRYLGEDSREKWSFPGTGIKKEEKDFNLVIENSIKNELKVEAKNITLFKKYEKTTKNSVIKSTYLIGEIKGKIQINNKKYTQFQWFDLNEELYFEDFAFNEKDIISELIEKIKLE